LVIAYTLAFVIYQVGQLFIWKEFDSHGIIR
jgi:hypothetical protein